MKMDVLKGGAGLAQMLDKGSFVEAILSCSTRRKPVDHDRLCRLAECSYDGLDQWAFTYGRDRLELERLLASDLRANGKYGLVRAHADALISLDDRWQRHIKSRNGMGALACAGAWLKFVGPHGFKEPRVLHLLDAMHRKIVDSRCPRRKRKTARALFAKLLEYAVPNLRGRRERPHPVDLYIEYCATVAKLASLPRTFERFRDAEYRLKERLGKVSRTVIERIMADARERGDRYDASRIATYDAWRIATIALAAKHRWGLRATRQRLVEAKRRFILSDHEAPKFFPA